MCPCEIRLWAMQSIVNFDLFGVFWHRWQMKKIFNQKSFYYFFGTPLCRRINIKINFFLQVHLKMSAVWYCSHYLPPVSFTPVTNFLFPLIFCLVFVLFVRWLFADCGLSDVAVVGCCWFLVVRRQLLDVGCWLLVVAHFLHYIVGSQLWSLLRSRFFTC